MKIISGKYKNREISSPELDGTHPMGSREKLALFNMIFEYLPGAVVLDAYAGSGALGIEALSRGADFCYFVEKNPAAARTIVKNLEAVGCSQKGKVVRSAVADFKSDAEFDVIMADPPYDRFDTAEVANLTLLLKAGGIFVLSHPGEAPELDGITLVKTHKYAAAHISIYQK